MHNLNLTACRTLLNTKQDVACQLEYAIASAAASSQPAAASSAASESPAPRIGRVPGAPMALMLPGSGPHAVDYSCCGAFDFWVAIGVGCMRCI